MVFAGLVWPDADYTIRRRSLSMSRMAQSQKRRCSIALDAVSILVQAIVLKGLVPRSNGQFDKGPTHKQQPK